MDREDPRPGTCIGINFRTFDSSGVEVSLERCHGLVEAITADEVVIMLGGAKRGTRYAFPRSAELLPLPGGQVYFPESDEWVTLAFFHEAVIHRRS